ncbi:MAG: response regulator [Crocinitomicaceae bacterium]
MKILIIDDESKARSLLVNVLKEAGHKETEIYTASNLEEGVNAIREIEPQLVFLDIEMPKQPGTDLLNYFKKEEITFEIVFTTAYSQYAIQAFEMNAIDYLLKPIRPPKVLDVVERVKKTKK